MITRLITSLLLIFTLSATSARAGEYLLGLDYAAFTVGRIFCNRDYLVPEVKCRDWKGDVALDADFSMGPLFFRNKVHGEGTDSRFRTMGWKYEIGLSLPKGVEIGWSHHSRHALDQGGPIVRSHDRKYLLKATNEFPVYDAVFLRFVVYGTRRN